MRIRTLIQGTLFLFVTFYVLPRAFVALGERAGWPRWESSTADVAGALLIVGGVGVLLYCSRLFRSIGRGTPVPIEPPTQLVEAGLYRYSRNPIYVADVAIFLGIFLVVGSLGLLLWTLLAFLILHAWVVWQEEPLLVKRFGAEYEDYRRRVPRWIGRVAAS